MAVSFPTRRRNFGHTGGKVPHAVPSTTRNEIEILVMAKPLWRQTTAQQLKLLAF